MACDILFDDINRNNHISGKTYRDTDFNAAVAFEREKNGVKFNEVLNFGWKVRHYNSTFIIIKLSSKFQKQ